MNVSVRSMTLADCDTLAELFDALDAYHREHLPALFRRPEEPPRRRAFCEDVLKDDGAEVLVAETDRVIGFVHVRLFSAPDLPIFVPQSRVLIDAVFVDPAHRRTGVGSLLIEKAEAWAETKGAAGVDLNVYEFNEKGRGLFAAMGFSTLSRRMSKSLP